MKSAHRSALAWSISVVLPLAVACGSNGSSGLFTQSSGGQGASTGGSLATGGGSTARGGSSSGGKSSANGGASATGNTGGTGQGLSGSTGVAGHGAAGMNAGGMSAGGVSAGGAGASAGTGGASAGNGNAGNGNAGSGNAGTGGASAGAGGMSAGGTGGGSSGSGGSGGVGQCPDNAPVNGAVCAVSAPDGCYYPGVACSCLSQNGGGGPITTKGKWACIGSRVPPCVQDLPMTGDVCLGHAGALCPYSSTDICVCFADVTPKWDCSADKNFMCPDNSPNNGGPCTTVAICPYASGACACNGAKWACQGG